MRSKSMPVVVLFLVLSLILGVFGCTPATPSKTADTASPASPPEILKIGLIMPLSGGGAPWGLAIRAGAEMYADDINSSGGIDVGGKKYTVKIVAEDDKYLAPDAVKAANKLIFEDNVKFIIGTVGSPGAIAIAPLCDENKVMRWTTAGNDAVIGPTHPLCFRVGVPWGAQAGAIFDYIAKTYPEVKNAATIDPSGAGGEFVAQQCVAAGQARGWKNVATEFYERGTTDFYPLITKILATKPDLINFDSVAPGDLALMVKQAKELGYSGKMSSVSALDKDILTKIAGAAAVEGFMGQSGSPDDLCQPGKDLYARIKAKYGKEFGDPLMMLTWYEMASSIVTGIKQAGTLDVEKVKVAVQNGRFYSRAVCAEFSYGGEKTYGIKNQIISPVLVYQILDGKLVFKGTSVPQVP
jgi:branched-chain amino acid transport system substrate-binding protein